MALYEYQCENCGNRFERIHRFSDPPPDTCPKCGQGPVRKLVSSPAFQFKGSGFYVTDYVKKSGVADADTKSGSSKDSKSKDAASTPEAAKDSSSKDTSAAESKTPAKDTLTTPSKPTEST